MTVMQPQNMHPALAEEFNSGETECRAFEKVEGSE